MGHFFHASRKHLSSYGCLIRVDRKQVNNTLYRVQQSTKQLDPYEKVMAEVSVQLKVKPAMLLPKVVLNMCATLPVM